MAAQRKRASGGKRAVEKKHRSRDDQRPDGYREGEVAIYQRLIARYNRKPKTAANRLEKHIAMLDAIGERALLDPGLPPEQAREQALRASSAAIKAAEPKRLIDELAAELRQAHAELHGLRDVHAAKEPPSGPRRPPAPQH